MSYDNKDMYNKGIFLAAITCSNFFPIPSLITYFISSTLHYIYLYNFYDTYKLINDQHTRKIRVGTL